MRKYIKRKFYQGECLHIYQRSIKGYNLFYDIEDFLVFYTIVSVISRVYDVVLLEMCLMIDHVHLLLSASSIDKISAFVRHYTSVYVLESNHDIGRKGPLFHKSYGSAPKKGSKKIRSAIVYIGNNPVEKNLCVRAEQYRWNFLAYLNNDTPFSKPVSYMDRSFSLNKAMKEVRNMVKLNRYLTHSQVRRLLEGQSEIDRSFLVDYIISKYYPFHKESLLSYYESVDEMFHAMKSTAGAEHDLEEVYYSGSDEVYRGMINVIRREFQIFPIRSVVALPMEQKIVIARTLQKKTSASKRQIAKFLHIEWTGL